MVIWQFKHGIMNKKKKILKELKKIQGPNRLKYFNEKYAKTMLGLEEIDPLERIQEDDSIE